MEQRDAKITIRAIIMGAIFSGLFAWLTVYFENRMDLILTATQISVLPYVLLFLFVLLVNPILALVRVLKPLSIAEILIVFVMGSVSSGISTFGLASQFVPAVGNLFNEHMNDDQSKWDQYIQPYINEGFFLSVPGIQQASIEYSEALSSYRDVEKVLSAAKSLDNARDLIDEAKANVEKVKGIEAEAVAKAAMVSKASRSLRFAEDAEEKANQSWENVMGELSLETVLKDYPELVAQRGANLEARHATLDDLEKQAFAKVKVLRRGLPKEMRAIPGIIPQPGDNWSVYWSRVNRLKHGSAALVPLATAHTSLKEKGTEPLIQAQGELAASIDESITLLQPIGNPDAGQATKEELEEEFEGLSKQLESMKKKLKDVNQERRMAEARDFDALDTRIRSLGASVAVLQKAYNRKSIEVERARKELEFTERVVAVIGQLTEYKTEAGAYIPCTAGAESLRKIIWEFPANQQDDGSTASAPLTTALTSLEQEGRTPLFQISGKLAASIDESIKLLQPLGISDDMQAMAEKLERDFGFLSMKLRSAKNRLKEVNLERQKAEAKDIASLDTKIKEFGRRVVDLQEDYNRQILEVERARKDLEFPNTVEAFITRLMEFKAGAATYTTCSSGAGSLKEIMSEIKKFDGTYRRFFVGDINWSEWARPIMNWGLIIILTYVILMTFNVLIFRQWAHNEKLIYPLAELPEILCGHDEGKPGVPTIFKSGLFWVGALIPGFFLGWNLFVKSGVVPGFETFDMNNGWGEHVEGTFLSGLRRQRFVVFFTMIGLSFLIPAKISFSLWFFYVLYMAQLQGMVWAGYGVDDRSFPKYWWYTLNFQTAEAGGAMLVFAALILFKCRGTLFCFFRPSFIANLEKDEQTELKISSFLFLFGSLTLIVFLWKAMGANLFYTVFFFVVVLVITIGLIRAVAEGGILGFQCWFGPFHLIRSIFGMNKAWTSSSLYAPLMVYYSLLFLDIKTFIAPAMANSIKIRDDLRLSRARFHGAIFIGIGVAIVVSVISHLILAYSSGADGMQNWFYTSFPRGMFKKIVGIAKSQPVDNAGGAFWLAFGGSMMAGLLYLRQFYFWLPHPIGMIMLVNPIMGAYWFSIFLGWLAKSLITKYGNKETYRVVRSSFVGLIVGELIIIVLAMIVSVWTGSGIGIDLNRN
ncbi:MAG: hypothetical protein QGF00_07455 [Planctomycetota bacterium]|jgi:hypothetical protein|nr:hypothetical protein [Planctomycetota bacterium]